MDLKGLNVLIDGYNLELKYGTGIKTYGLTLIEALRLLGANVNILFSTSSSSDPILNEILFFDRQINNFDKKVKFDMIKNTIKALSRIRFKAKKFVIISGAVIKRGLVDNFIDSVGIFNLPQCYKIANILYRSLRVTTTISVPEKIDVWHATYPLPIKIRKAKKIKTIHELIPLRLPYTTLDDKRTFYKNIKNSLKDSEIIITISENTKKDLLSIYDINPDKIYVTYQPIRIAPVNYDREKTLCTLKKYKLDLRDYILFVGAIEPKKNVGRLIDAYNLLETKMPLVIVGKKAWLWEDEISGRNLNNVRLLDYVHTEDLRHLYAGAYCFVFPSLYEGFGLPPLEAMASGCPVITSNVSSLPEVCGDAALYVDPYDVADIKEKMNTLLDNPQLRDRLSEASKERAKLFSMENYIKKLYEAYSKIV